MNDKLKAMIDLLDEEQRRVKVFLNENNFNCMTAPFAIARRYRTELKQHIAVLRDNLHNK